MKDRTYKIALLGLYTALAMIFGYIEILFPIGGLLGGIPGIKLGLANLVILFMLERFTPREAALVSVVRILLIDTLFGRAGSIPIAMGGAFLSLLVMSLLKYKTKAGTCAISIAGGIAHNIGQVIVVLVWLKVWGYIYYAPVLIIAGMITGFVIGLLVTEVLRRVRKGESRA